MSNIERVEELFGTQVREIVERSKRQTWDIQSALTTDYTDIELSPPDDAVVEKPTLNARISQSNDSLFILNMAKHNYDLFDESEAYKRLLRVGPRLLCDAWGEKIVKLDELEHAATITSNYLPQDDFTQSLLHREQGLPDIGKSICDGTSRQQRVFWYQKLMASRLSEQLAIPQSDLLHLSILAAGIELGKTRDIRSEKQDSIIESFETFGERLDERVQNDERIVYRAIAECLNTKDRTDIVDRLRQRCPNVWQDFQENWSSPSTSGGGVQLWDDLQI